MQKAIGSFPDDAIAHHARQRGDKVILRTRDRSFSAAELDNCVNAVMSRFQELGIRPRDHIASILDNTVEHACLILAAMRSNVVVVPISTKYHPEVIDHILKDARVVHAFANQNLANRISYPNVSSIALDSLPKPQTKTESPHRNLSDLAVIFYTSGSTGRPKGVMASYANLMYGIDSVCQFLPITDATCMGTVLPLAFDAGLNSLLCGINAGSETCLLRYIFPQSLADQLIEHEVTMMLAVPSILFSLSACSSHPIPSIRTLASTGGRMDHATIEALERFMPNMEFTVMYGLTEAFRSTHLPPEFYKLKPNSIGIAIPHTHVCLLDESGMDVATGEVGEFVHSGPLVGLGYWNNLGETRKRYRPCPPCSPYFEDGAIAVFSGDLGTRDGDGFFYHIGRKDRMIKSNGYRIAPSEIEIAVEKHTPAHRAYAVGVADVAKGQSIVVFIEGHDSQIEDDSILRDMLRNHLSSFMLPDRFISVENFPLNSNGKIDEHQLLSIL